MNILHFVVIIIKFSLAVAQCLSCLTDLYCSRIHTCVCLLHCCVCILIASFLLCVDQIWKAHLHPITRKKCANWNLQDSHWQHTKQSDWWWLSNNGCRSGRVSTLFVCTCDVFITSFCAGTFSVVFAHFQKIVILPYI